MGKQRAKGESWRQAYSEGLKALSEEDLAAAERLFAKAVDLGADRWEPFYARAWASLQNGDSDRPDALVAAEADFLKALELGGPLCPEASAALGDLAARRGDHELACTHFIQALGRSTQQDVVEDGLVGSLTKLLQDLEADPDAEGVLDTCSRLEKHLEAASLPQALLSGLLAEVVATRAVCQEAKGHKLQAADSFHRLGQLVPNHPRIPAAHRGDRRRPLPSGARAANDPTFEDIGGREVSKTSMNRLCGIFDRVFHDADLEGIRKRQEETGEAPTRSYLLFGPSGCGKTYIIRAFAGEYFRRHNRDLPLHRLRLNEVMNKWVGDTEKAITRMFEEAMQTQPSILFADEVDAIGASRETGGQAYRIDQTTHLLQEVDRLRTQGAFVLFFGCTNRVWAVDMALLRRFDEFILVEPPNDVVRARVFEVHLKRVAETLRPKKLDLPLLARASHGMMAGDIEKAIRRAKDDLMGEQAQGGAKRLLNDADLMEAIEQTRNPMHLQLWMGETLSALRAAGFAERAEEVQRVYGPYVGDIQTTNKATQAAPGWRPIPEDAWKEEQQYDHQLLRLRRR
jgi:AAA+ superfamily predicted ATPase